MKLPNKLVIGGPNNGEHAPWHGDIVELPDGTEYRKAKVNIDDESTEVYVLSTITNKEALKLLQEEYLGIP